MDINGTSGRNIYWHTHSITRTQREWHASHCKSFRKHKGAIIWLTGLSGAGKSTIANAVEERLYREGCRTFVLDGDNIRHGLCEDLGFSIYDRQENLRRVSEVSKLFVEAGIITLAAFISPLQEERLRIRNLLQQNNYFEVFCNCGLDICEQRDKKGLYRKAREGLISDFTGISSPYQPPTNAELVLDTGNHSIDDCVSEVLQMLKNSGVFF